MKANGTSIDDKHTYSGVQHGNDDTGELMRYRREAADGDYTFGSGDDTLLINSPEAVAQAVKTLFELWYGQIPQRGHREFSLCSVNRNPKPTIWRSVSASSKRGALNPSSLSIRQRTL